MPLTFAHRCSAHCRFYPLSFSLPVNSSSKHNHTAFEQPHWGRGLVQKRCFKSSCFITELSSLLSLVLLRFLFCFLNPDFKNHVFDILSFFISCLYFSVRLCDICSIIQVCLWFLFPCVIVYVCLKIPHEAVVRSFVRSFIVDLTYRAYFICSYDVNLGAKKKKKSNQKCLMWEKLMWCFLPFNTVTCSSVWFKKQNVSHYCPRKPHYCLQTCVCVFFFSVLSFELLKPCSFYSFCRSLNLFNRRLEIVMSLCSSSVSWSSACLMNLLLFRNAVANYPRNWISFLRVKHFLPLTSITHNYLCDLNSPGSLL